MKDIVFTKDVEFNGKTYFKGNTIKLEDVQKEDLKNIWFLNEKGFIEPITYKDFIEFSESLKNPKYKKREDDISEQI